MNAAAIHSAEILARFANPADGNKKPSIKAADGTYYGVKPADFGRFQPGGRYRIDYTERDYKGKTYRDIVKCEPVVSGDARGAGAPSSSQRSVSGGEGATGASAEFDFVTRMLAARVASCGVGWSAEDLAREARFLRSVYREVWG